MRNIPNMDVCNFVAIKCTADTKKRPNFCIQIKTVVDVLYELQTKSYKNVNFFFVAITCQFISKISISNLQ